MVFFGSMMNTLRMVKAMPFSSTLVASWWSILCVQKSVFEAFAAILSSCSFLLDMGAGRSFHSHVVCQCHLSLLVPNDRKSQVAA